MSNLYTLYDFKEIWNPGELENKDISDKISELEMIAQLKARGYTITKEKEKRLESSVPAKVTEESSTNKNLSSTNNNNNKTHKCQYLRYNMEQIKALYDYDLMINDYPEKEEGIDNIMNVLFETLNSTQKTMKINKQTKDTMVVIGKLMKLTYMEILFVLDKYNERTEKIPRPLFYLRTMLYNAKEQYYFETMNKVNYDNHE